MKYIDLIIYIYIKIIGLAFLDGKSEGCRKDVIEIYVYIRFLI
jgi:hypothetical protein